MTDMLENWRPEMIGARTRTPFTANLGAEILDVGVGRARLRLPWSENVVGNAQTGEVHGGVITAMLDQACGLSIISALPGPAVFVTLDLRVDRLGPARPHADLLFEAECPDAGLEIMFLRGICFQDDPQKPIAVATGTFMFTQMPKLPA